LQIWRRNMLILYWILKFTKFIKLKWLVIGAWPQMSLAFVFFLKM
jgi:hypothetical protein